MPPIPDLMRGVDLSPRLRAVCDDVFIDGLPNNVAALFIELAKRIDGDT